jgi:hypothetical protein
VNENAQRAGGTEAAERGPFCAVRYPGGTVYGNLGDFTRGGVRGRRAVSEGRPTTSIEYRECGSLRSYLCLEAEPEAQPVTQDVVAPSRPGQRGVLER